MNYRILAIAVRKDGVPATLEEDSRSVEVVAATENPVEVMDWKRWEIVNEVLLMDGLELPKSRQVPLLDTHSRYQTASVLGSFRGIETDNGQLVGRAHFSSVPEAEGLYTKVREGHLTDFSIGYRVVESVWIPEESKKKVKGREFEGPLSVATRWRVKELSAVPIGADEDAKVRAESDHSNNMEENEMNKEFRKLLEGKGLSPDATDDEARAFAETLTAPKEEQRGENDEIDVEKIRTEATGKERERIREIDAMCKKYNCPDMADTLVREETSVLEARAQVLKRFEADLAAKEEKMKHRKPAEIGVDERDKFRAAGQDALLLRAGLPVEKPAPGADELQGYTLVEMARNCLAKAAQKTRGNVMEMVGRAMVTSDFPYLLANVANKSLFNGWDSQEETWKIWCGTGAVSDFKTHYSPRVSEASALEEVPEHGEYKYGKKTEAQESYSVVTYGKLFAITRQTIINDDLNALINQPKAHGESASRKVGDVAYAVLTGNSAMGDSIALFHASHSNLVAPGSGAAPGIATIAAGVLAMKSQKDLQSLRRLNIQPRFMLAPNALEGAAEIFFRSERFTDSDTVATDASLAGMRVNPYAGNYLTRVYEGRLDDDDPAQWYLAADKGKTVTVYFLNGIQTPYLETKQGWSVDGVEYKVRIDVGAKAMDWRGLYQNDGN